MSISNINTVHWFPIFVKYSISSNELYVYVHNNASNDYIWYSMLTIIIQ